MIRALYDYYEQLIQKGMIVDDAYQEVNIGFIISITEDGIMDDLIECRTNKKPKICIMPRRTVSTKIESNIVEQRSAYLFGVKMSNKALVLENPARHEKAVKDNLDFTEGMASPLINAFRNFLQKWKPEDELSNPFLLSLKSTDFNTGFAFCLSGHPEHLLHDEPEIKEKWEFFYQEKETNNDCIYGQCSVTGKKNVSIARLHRPIKHIFNGQAAGCILSCYNSNGDCSYGHVQSYNSDVSYEAMVKYTSALNYLTASPEHRRVVGNTTVLFWASNDNNEITNIFRTFMFGDYRKEDDNDETEEEYIPDSNNSAIDVLEMDSVLNALMRKVKNGILTEMDIDEFEKVSGDTRFYMLGLEPNNSRIMVKFFHDNSCADMLRNIAKFQSEICMHPNGRPTYFWQIKNQLTSPKITDADRKAVNPEITNLLFQAALKGTRYPVALLANAISRVRKDSAIVNLKEDKDAPKKENAKKESTLEKKRKRDNIAFHPIRMGIIKACLIRNYKEDLQMALDENNTNRGYVCGRIFAVLESAQEAASTVPLNRTIREKYFATASANPVIVFPSLVRTAQHHLAKIKKNKERKGLAFYFDRRLGEMMNMLEGNFPQALNIQEQGMFIMGYYQEKNRKHEKKEEESVAKLLEDMNNTDTFEDEVA